MNVADTLDELKKAAIADPALKDRLMATRNDASPVTAFCKISTEAGFPLYTMDLIEYGEESYAAMRRSTNGGGENSPLLEGEDDYYNIFLSELEAVYRRRAN